MATISASKGSISAISLTEHILEMYTKASSVALGSPECKISTMEAVSMLTFCSGSSGLRCLFLISFRLGSMELSTITLYYNELLNQTHCIDHWQVVKSARPWVIFLFGSGIGKSSPSIVEKTALYYLSIRLANYSNNPSYSNI